MLNTIQYVDQSLQMQDFIEKSKKEEQKQNTCYNSIENYNIYTAIIRIINSKNN
jgi:hypothetical protein